MKHWTNEEIAWVSESVGGNPSEIIQQLQSRIRELDLKKFEKTLRNMWIVFNKEQ